MILLIDNYDSFAHNLQRYLVRLGQEVIVVRNDDQRLADALDGNTSTVVAPLFDIPANFKAIVISPGPKRPCEAGYGLALVRRLSGVVPILGVCLGHQIICEAFGARIVRARQPLHGLATPIVIERGPLFDGFLDTPDSKTNDGKATVDFARYHSLVAETASLPACLKVTAWSEDGQIMAVQHLRHTTFGIQFHPESILSLHGYRLLRNFLATAGCQVDEPLPAGDLVDEQLLTAWRPTELDAAHDIAVHAVAHPTEFGGK